MPRLDNVCTNIGFRGALVEELSKGKLASNYFLAHGRMISTFHNDKKSPTISQNNGYQVTE